MGVVKVTLNSSPLIDITDTTATAGDVANSKYYYNVAGNKTQGTITSRTSTDLSASNLTVTAPSGYYASSASKTLSDANLVAGNIKDGTTIFGVTGTYSGGSANIQSLSVTQNGTYTASGGVDGYSPVTVNVSGGASNIITGELTTGSTAGATETKSISYSGNGYPVALLMYIKNGMYNDTSTGDTNWYNSTMLYAAGAITLVKCNTTTTPTYSGNSAENTATVAWTGKNNSSSPTSYGRFGSPNSAVYLSNPGSYLGTANGIVAITNNTTIQYKVADGSTSSRGLLASTTYTYWAIYSE